MVTQTLPTCRVIHAAATYKGKQALTYVAGISTESAGSQAICMHLLSIPPGGRAKAHLHENHETTIYIISGTAALWYGDQLEQHVITNAGDFIYIPAGVPHLPYNPSRDESFTAMIARTDPNEQESVVLRPDLDGLRA
jgi:uncharacterized RmlC-like cupin family protein